MEHAIINKKGSPGKIMFDRTGSRSEQLTSPIATNDGFFKELQVGFGRTHIFLDGKVI